MTADPELMDLLEASGCLGNVIGFESLSATNLRAMQKGPAMRMPGRIGNAGGWDRYARAVEILRAHHLQTWAAFTLGHDADTPESIRETGDFALSNRFCFAAFNILMPYPATPLYDRLNAEGRLMFDGKWWLHPEWRFNHASFQPARMSPEELTESCWQARYRWNRPSSVINRFFDMQTHLSSPAHAITYLKYNPLYSKRRSRNKGCVSGITKIRFIHSDRVLCRALVPDANLWSDSHDGLSVRGSTAPAPAPAPATSTSSSNQQPATSVTDALEARPNLSERSALSPSRRNLEKVVALPAAHAHDAGGPHPARLSAHGPVDR
jgi:hypothetical protein